MVRAVDGVGGSFVHEEEETDGPHPIRYVPLGRVYSATSPSKPQPLYPPSLQQKQLRTCIMPRGSEEKPFIVYQRRRWRKRPRMDSRTPMEAELGDGISKKKEELLKRKVTELGSKIDGADGDFGRKLMRNRVAKKSAISGLETKSRRKNRGATWVGKRWVELEMEGADPVVLVELQCKVFWPLDDEWYKGTVAEYNVATNKHKVLYEDGQEENLSLSDEKVKFHLSSEEMKHLNLKFGVSGVGKKGYNELLGLAVSLHDYQDLEPGDLVWAKLSGHAMWPAVVLDESKVCRKGLKPVRSDRSILVQFFGTHDFARIKLKQAVPFLVGLTSSMHLKCKQARFHLSLDEAKAYLSSQQLPKSMLQQQKTTGEDHSTDSHSEDGENSCEDLCNDEATRHNRASSIEIGDLRVTNLGRIIFDSDHFHNKQHIWPEGYTAFRKYSSTKDPNLETTYKMEVLRNPTLRSRPLFRVTTEYGLEIEGATPSSCWKEIFRIIKRECDGAHCEREAIHTQKSGSYMFGFSNSQIRQLVQELPNAQLCSKYFEGCRDVPLGYKAVHVDWKNLDKCNVCDMDEEYIDNLFLQCDKCRMMVHARCYGELENSDGKLWLCNLCRPGAPDFVPRCCLCPVEGGAIKPTNDGRWAHLTCAMWIPETCLVDIKKMEPIDGINRINKNRWKLLCSICGVSYGACIQCSHHTCRVAYHPLCARAAGLCVELEDEEKLQLMSVDDEDNHCIRLLSYCKKHRAPSRECLPIAENDAARGVAGSANKHPSNPSGCARCEPYDLSIRRGQKQPEVVSASSVKRLYVENIPYVISGHRQNVNSFYNSNNMQITGSEDAAQIESQCNISSMVEKYKNMKATFRKRLAFGKSKIHGFGVFAKVPHKAGDMVIEYIGEIVRQSIADLRERHIYNKLVGAGTYMFKIDEERVVDATRAGSIAHLINHSCEPNCYSRTICVLGDEHIIIFAKRDITQWEELTYDYRFYSIDEQLPCYCGFPRCRGVVNDTEAEEQTAKLRLHRSDLSQWNCK